jgi:hypothetical protein
LSLVDRFDNRILALPWEWSADVYRPVGSFLRDALSRRRPLHVYLEAHASIAFAAGYVLDPKSGADVVVSQKGGPGTVIWSPVGTPESDYPGWVLREVRAGKGDTDQTDVAAVISLTHSAVEDVLSYCDSLPTISRVVNFVLPSGASGSSVQSGPHAQLLVDQFIAWARSGRTRAERLGSLHLFIAAPNGFSFFLGRHARALGRCHLYEYDFDTNEPAAYRPSLSFPETEVTTS